MLRHKLHFEYLHFSIAIFEHFVCWRKKTGDECGENEWPRECCVCCKPQCDKLNFSGYIYDVALGPRRFCCHLLQNALNLQVLRSMHSSFAHDMPLGGKLDSFLKPSFEILENLSVAS